jgi:hypothetical protein
MIAVLILLALSAAIGFCRRNRAYLARNPDIGSGPCGPCGCGAAERRFWNCCRNWNRLSLLDREPSRLPDGA